MMWLRLRPMGPLMIHQNPLLSTRNVLAIFMRRKFTFLLAAILVINITRLMTVNDMADRLILDLLGAAMLVAATLSLCVEKKSRTIALALGTPAILLSLFQRLIPGHSELLISTAVRLSSMVYVAFIITVVLRVLMTQPEVTRDSIAGAFCGYILIGVVFADAYCLLDSFVPHSFQFSGVAEKNLDDPLQRWLMLEYFSFTTLSTLGIGDILPLTPAARGLTMWEVVCGQFYLAVLVAGLVNLRGSADMTQGDAKKA